MWSATTTAPTTIQERSTEDFFSELITTMGFDVALWISVVCAIIGFRFFLQKNKGSQAPGHRGARSFPKDVPVIRKPTGARNGLYDRDSSKAPVPKAPLEFAQVVDLTISTRLQASRALAHYNDYKEANKHLTFDKDLAEAKSAHSALDFYTALVQCAGRAGRPSSVLQLLDDMREAGLERPRELYESAMKLLARQRFHSEAIAVYNRFEEDGLQPSAVTLSCLVAFAVECGDMARAHYFFEKLESQEAPSVKACMILLRAYAKKNDWSASVDLLKQMGQRGGKFDSVLLNTVLATGVASGQLEAAKKLLQEEAAFADVISYNTILKGLAQQADIVASLAFLEKMCTVDVLPNVVSFNTVMDAAVRGQQPKEAWRLFATMQKEAKLEPDKCSCSTLVKALQLEATSKQIVTILGLIDTVFEECSEQLRSSLLRGTLEASLWIAHAPTAMRAFKKMFDNHFALNSKELHGLISLTAKAGDAEGCRAIWMSAVQNPDFIVAWSAVNNLMMMGYTIDSASLMVPEFGGDTWKGDSWNGDAWKGESWKAAKEQNWHPAKKNASWRDSSSWMA